MRYHLYNQDLDYSKRKWRCSEGDVPYEGELLGFIGMYNDDPEEFVWFRIVKPLVNKYGWLVERDEPVTGYWSEVFKEGLVTT